MDGVLQQLPVEVGQRVNPGNKSRPRRRSDKTESADQDRGDAGERHSDQPEGLDRHAQRRRRPVTSFASIPRSSREPSRSTSRSMDELPKGARPDLSVDGTIELERLDNVVYVGRPAFGQDNSTVGIFKIVAGSSRSGSHAGETRPQLRQHDRNSERPSTRRPGHPFRHQRLGFPRTHPPRTNYPL